MKPTYDELAEAYRDLYEVAKSVADGFENHTDHYTWSKGMNPVEDLREELENARWDDALHLILYGPDDDEDEPLPPPEDKLMPNDRGEQFVPIDDNEIF